MAGFVVRFVAAGGTGYAHTGGLSHPRLGEIPFPSKSDAIRAARDWYNGGVGQLHKDGLPGDFQVVDNNTGVVVWVHPKNKRLLSTGVFVGIESPT